MSNTTEGAMRRTLRATILGASLLALGACTNPYSPGQRAVGGGLLGAGGGAGVAAVTGGDPGTGALIGGALGALGGAVTTPQEPRYYDEGRGRGRGYGHGRRHRDGW